MKFRRSILLITAMSAALVGVGAYGSYVVEADGANISTEAIATGADFDFVAHDFGIEAAEAIQITLANLSSAANLQGNLLLWSFAATDNPSSDDAVQDAESFVEPPAATALVTAGTGGSSEDYSYYDEGAAGTAQDGNGPGAAAVGGQDGGPVSTVVPLAASVQHLPAIDTNAIFWILKPAEFTSFSQMTAARFGFTVGHDQNSN
jgi:hypothetical protein